MKRVMLVLVVVFMMAVPIGTAWGENCTLTKEVTVQARMDDLAMTEEILRPGEKVTVASGSKGGLVIVAKTPRNQNSVVYSPTLSRSACRP